MFVLRGKGVRVQFVGFGADQKSLITVSSDNSNGRIVETWGLQSRRVRTSQKLDFDEGYAHGEVVVSPDHKLVAFAGVLGESYLYSAANGSRVATVKGDKFAFSADGRVLATQTYEPKNNSHALRIWDGKDWKERGARDCGAGFAAMAFTPDGSMLAVIARRRVLLLDASTLEVLNQTAEVFDGSGTGDALAFSPDGASLAAYGLGAKYFELARQDNRPVLTPIEFEKRHPSPLFDSRFAFSPDGKLLATFREGPPWVTIWNVATKNLAAVLPVVPARRLEGITSVAFSPDGTMLALGGRDQGEPEHTTQPGDAVVTVWDVKKLLAGDPLAAHAAASVSQVLERARTDDDRIRVLRGIGLVGPHMRSAVPQLQQALQDGNPRVRWVSALLLGSIGPDARDATSALRALASDSDSGCRDAAIRALSHIDPAAAAAASALAAAHPAAQREAAQVQREAAQRVACQSNLRQIATAMHLYHDVNKSLPPAIVYDKNGKPMHSWRVLVLPFLEESKLYDQYNFNEPWDSENNLKVAAQMPDIFKCPASHAAAGHTCYVVPVGQDTAFPYGEKTTLDGIAAAKANGTAWTIMLLEVDDAKAVPWTKPEDWAFDPKQPLPSQGEHHRNTIGTGFNVSMCDVSTNFVSTGVLREFLREAFTLNKGEARVAPEVTDTKLKKSAD